MDTYLFVVFDVKRLSFIILRLLYIRTVTCFCCYMNGPQLTCAIDWHIWLKFNSTSMHMQFAIITIVTEGETKLTLIVGMNDKHECCIG